MTASAAALIRDVEVAGGHLTANGDHLRVTAPAPLPDALVDALRRHKHEVLSHLTAVAGDEQEAFEERAAILQFDGELSREEAERRAAVETGWNG